MLTVGRTVYNYDLGPPRAKLLAVLHEAFVHVDPDGLGRDFKEPLIDPDLKGLSWKYKPYRRNLIQKPLVLNPQNHRISIANPT